MRGLALLAMFFSGTLMAAKGTQTIYLATPVRAGNAELPRGICEVSWNAASGSRVRLTIKTEDGKTLTVSARMVKGKQDTTGVVTSDRQHTARGKPDRSMKSCTRQLAPAP
jgi:hypothetical protein